MHRKRVILMYISEVSGHHSATIAIEKAIKLLEPETEVLNINAFNYTNPISEKIVNRIYMGVIKRTPKLWDYLYDNPSVVKKLEKIKNTVHRFNSPKFKKLFDKFHPDVVACTQAFPCGMVADYKRDYGSEIPLVAVLTDYVPHSYWIYDRINYYVVPSDDVAGRLCKKGVPLSKIKPLGIPFDPKFTLDESREEVARKLGLDGRKHTILIMGGGQGLGPIKSIVKLLDTSDLEMQMIIVTGTNKKLYKHFNGYKHNKKTLVFGYANNINHLMSVSDVIITKPGGITTAEALAKKLPMIIVKPIPGQEENNTTYLTRHKAAVRIDDPDSIYGAIEGILSNPERLREMRESVSRIAKPRASLDTARLLLDLAAKPHA